MKRSPLAGLVLFSLGVALLGAGCAPASTPVPTAAPAMNPAEAGAPLPTEFPYTVAEAEALAGFDVLEPAYLPAGVSFDHAAYQDAPHPHVTLYFKLVHETFGDLGTSFQITQAPQAEAVPDPNACSPAGDECELLRTGGLEVRYRLTAPTESLLWETGDFSFHLLRTAGEPGKVYKDELLKVAGSLQ